MKWDEEIKEAIRHQTILRIHYLSTKSAPLDLEPHAYGLDSRGDRVLLAWDRAVQRDDGFDDGWDIYRVDEIVLLSVAGHAFGGARRGYRHDTRDIPTIYAQL